MKSEKNLRRIALLLAAVVIFCVVFSAFLTVSRSHHHCEGEDCRICWQISLCQKTVRNMGISVLAVQALSLLRMMAERISVQTGGQSVCLSPVALKVKLSD